MIAALIHPRLHGTPELSRGTAIAPGDPIFQVMSNGDDILYKIDANGSLLQQDSDPQFNIIYSIINSKESVYPLFINEAAYNEKDIAFLLMHKKEIDIAIFQLDEWAK